MKENDNEQFIPPITSHEIFYFNCWIILNILITLYIIILLLPENFISNSLGLSFFPQKYWFIAIPTYFLTTLFGLTICVICYELIMTIDEPPINDLYYNELSIEEMIKEIDYSPSEGILPDAGDINYKIVQEVINMDND